jgi:hypothetical protein
MENRNTFLNNFRGETLGTISNQSSQEEIFQNKTLRPILKLQNDLFVEVVRNQINKHKNDFYNFPVEKKLAYIDHLIKNDMKFRNSLKGIIISLFTIDEYKNYIQNSSNLNKRMMNMLIERIKNQVQLLEFVVEK